MCKFHPYNQLYILCETCNELICDKCKFESHKIHKTEDNVFARNSDFIINIFTHFYAKIKRIQDDQLKNFKDKIGEVDKLVYLFFENEMSRVDSATQDIINLLTRLKSTIKKLVSLFQEKFREKFQVVKYEHDKFGEEILNCKYNYLN